MTTGYDEEQAGTGNPLSIFLLFVVPSSAGNKRHDMHARSLGSAFRRHPLVNSFFKNTRSTQSSLLLFGCHLYPPAGSAASASRNVLGCTVWPNRFSPGWCYQGHALIGFCSFNIPSPQRYPKPCFAQSAPALLALGGSRPTVRAVQSAPNAHLTVRPRL